MGKGEFNYASQVMQEFSWDDIKKHNKKDDMWIVIDGSIYDISNWAKKHPGGRKIVSSYAGQDATVRIVSSRVSYNLIVFKSSVYLNNLFYCLHVHIYVHVCVCVRVRVCATE